MSDLMSRVEEIQKKALSRKREAPNLPAIPVQQNRPKQLPIWGSTVRGLPNSILRSALFGAIKRGKRAYMQGVPVASYEGVTILQTGPRLDQADLDVWEQCIHLARTGGLGTRIQVTGHGFLKAIGRNTSGPSHEWLIGALRRLMSCVVELKDGKKAYAGPLLHHWARDGETGHHVIEINPAIADLYAPDGWTAIEWEQRMALKRQPLAQWLHGFYASHAQPYPLKIDTIHRLCGSEAKEIRDFKKDLKDALGRVCRATGWKYSVEDDLVVITKGLALPNTQAKHVARRSLQKKKRPRKQ